MTQLAVRFLKLLLIIYVFVFAYEWWRPLPEGMTRESATYTVPDKGVRFFADIDKKDKKGDLTEVRAIEARYRELLKKAEHMVLMGEMYVPEAGSSSVTTLLNNKHLTDKHVAIALLTDRMSTRYGGISSEALDAQRKAGTLVIETDMNAMHDSNLLYSSFWRPFFSWWGNSPKGGWLSDPIGQSTGKFTLRSWLTFLNAKMNKSHFIFVDAPNGKTEKLPVLFASSDISAPRGSTGATALEVDDKIWAELSRSAGLIAAISASGLPSFSGTDIDDASGTLRARMLDVTHAHEQIIAHIKNLQQTDQLSIAMRFVSDRDVVSALKDAANRNVNIRVILDPNEEYFGHKLHGMPNRPVAKEFTSNISGGVEVRWCDPRKLPCESRMMLGKSASSTFLMVGGADLTSRDIGGYNIATEVLVESSHDFTASRDAQVYFDKMWMNDGGDYTVPYERFADDSFWRSSVYNIMERTGISLY